MVSGDPRGNGTSRCSERRADEADSDVSDVCAHCAEAGRWPVLPTKIGDLLRKDYDWSKDVSRIKAPTLLLFGDADAVPPAHAVQFFELFGGGKKDGGWDGSGMSNSRLAILPGLTHYTIFSSPMLASTVTPFLEAPMPGNM